MKKHISNIIRFVTFMAITFFLITKTGEIFILKGWEDDYQGQMYTMKGFEKLPKNQIDVLFVGASTSAKSVLPMQIYNETGITSYNYNMTSARIYMYYYFLQHVLKTQKPKLVVVDVVTLFYDTREEETEQRKSFDYLKLDDVKMKMILDDVFDTTFEDKASYIFPIMRYHDRWNELNLAEEINRINQDYNSITRGALVNRSIKANTKGYDYMKPANRKVEMQSYVEEYLNKFINLCKKENIEVLLLAIPDTRAWNYESSLKLAEIAEDKNVKVLDLNNEEKYPIDWNVDTHDGGMHMNIIGATKITNYITNYLKENYSFKDHRNDEYYQNWNDDLKLYNKRIKEEIDIAKSRINK